MDRCRCRTNCAVGQVQVCRIGGSPQFELLGDQASSGMGQEDIVSDPDIIDDVLARVSAAYGVTIADIFSERRTRRVLPARHAAIYLAQKLSDAGARDIGRRFGGRDYTTVLMTCRAMERLIAQDSQVAQALSRLESECSENPGCGDA